MFSIALYPLAALAASAASCAETTPVSETYAFHSETTITNDERTLLVQAHEGEVRSPLSEPGRPVIGVWRKPLPRSVLDELVAAIEEAGTGVHGPEDPMPAGALTTTFGIMDGEKPRALHTFLSGEPPDELARVRRSIDAAYQAIYEHPERVVRASARFEPARLRAGEDVRLVLELGAEGKLPLELRDPTGARTPEDVGLTLVLYRSSDSGERTYFRDVAFEPGDVRPLPLAGAAVEAQKGPRSAQLGLAPGEKRSFTMQRSVRLAPGKYPAFLRYESAGGEGDAFIRGTIEVDLSPLLVD